MATATQPLTETNPKENSQLDAENQQTPEDKFPPELVECFRDLHTKIGTRDLISRRMQVKDAWKQRLFYRSYQRLMEGQNGAWCLPGDQGLPAAGVGEGISDDWRQIENIYLAYASIIDAALTGSKPTCRFNADDINSADDVSAAMNADSVRQFVERNNDIPDLQKDVVRYLFTDGASYYHSFWCSEKEEEKILAYGVLECKRPISAKNLEESVWFNLSVEHDRNYLKEKYPEVKDEITGANAGSSQNQFDRIARISVNTGMGATAVTGDSFAYQATESTDWIRPAFYNELSKEREELMREHFPKGVRVTFVGTTFCEAMDETMDECWSEVHAYAGDGAHRESLGSPLVPIQERLNNLLDILYETFNHSIPWRWIASNKIDINALGDQGNLPGMTGAVEWSGQPISDYFFVETQIEVPQSLLVRIKELENEVAQLMTGAFPALFGGNTGTNDTAQGISIQRDQALGRLGLVWRSIKTAYARAIENIVRISAEYRQGAMSTAVPGRMGGDAQSLNIDFDALNIGIFKVYTDSDENFPESWTQKKNTFMMLLMAAEKNPMSFAASLLKDPNNMAFGKYMLGIPELEIPQEASRNKQLREIGKLLKAVPQVNPQFQQATAVVQKLSKQAMASGDPGMQQQIQDLQQKLQGMPQLVSSVPIDEDYDDHATEYQEVVDWINSPEGQKIKENKPQQFRNVRLHGLEHQAALQKKAANTPPPPKESVSVTIPTDKMPPEVQAQILALGGIKMDVAAAQQKQQQEMVAKQAGPQLVKAV